MGLDLADPAVANHWMKALESSLEAATGLENPRRHLRPRKLPRRSSIRFLARVERLAKWFPEEAPGNLGVGMLEALPARRDRQTNPRVRPSGKGFRL